MSKDRFYKFALPGTQERFRAERLAQPCRTICAWCGELRDGIMGENKVWFEKHRTKCKVKP